MKFIVSSASLLKEIQIIGGVVNNTNTLPILDNFLFEINEETLTLSASDLETTMSTSIKIESTDKGSIALPARLLTDTLKTFAEQPLTFIKTNENTIEIVANNGKYAVAFVSGEEFPKPSYIKDPNTTTIKGDVLSTAINSTLFASGNDDLRPMMTGVFFQFSSESLNFVATDAHKMVKYSRTDFSSENNAEFIMPKKPLQILKAIMTSYIGDVKIEYNDNNAQFIFDSSTLTCRLIDGKYPNYEAVIPKENPNILKIDRALFLNSVRRVSYFSNKTTHQIRLNIAGSSLIISAEDFDYSNKAEERMECDYKGEDLQIGFNSRFLIEMLNNLNTETIQLSMSLPNRAGLIYPVDNPEKSEHITMLVMPVMLND
ncbi:MAG: DNA polymerase III subunit beta [Flavobacteriaceae bacterium]|nr:DNA polymerase III subunit beta [Flavobacteriaceae bacterium]|tara:strand:- start:3075 stop:4193 length:1119 start_codon:yes stop_codon:yes gene_type:complete